MLLFNFKVQIYLAYDRDILILIICQFPNKKLKKQIELSPHSNVNLKNEKFSVISLLLYQEQKTQLLANFEVEISFLLFFLDF